MELRFEQLVQNNEKEIRWNNFLSQIEKIKDGLGKPVDSGIKETVAGFLANGLLTVNSCEGHLDRGRPYPFIDVNSELIFSDQVFKERVTLLQQKAKDKGYNQPRDIQRNDTELYPELLELRTASENYEKEIENKIQSLLSTFYLQHKAVSAAMKLTTWKAATYFSIQPTSGAGIGVTNQEKFTQRLKNMSLEETKAFLTDSRTEMAALTIFLKNNFFQGKSLPGNKKES